MTSYTISQRERKKRKTSFAEQINHQSFFPSRRDVIKSKEYQRLGFAAKSLYHDLSSQWNGKNNGDLCITFSLMSKNHGWKSNGTLRRALSELLEARFLIITRQGDRNRPSLYAFTALPINPCLDKNGLSKIEIKPTRTAPDYWRDEHQKLISGVSI